MRRSDRGGCWLHVSERIDIVGRDGLHLLLLLPVSAAISRLHGRADSTERTLLRHSTTITVGSRLSIRTSLANRRGVHWFR